MSKRDWINMVLVFVDISSFVAGIQQHFTEKMSKIFGLIEIGIYEYIIIFLSIIAFLFIYNKEWTEKHLDELTGKAKREREEKEEKTKLDELFVLIRKNIRFLTLKIEREGESFGLSSITSYNQTNLKIKLRLIDLGFSMPNEEEEASKDFDMQWHTFLSLLEVAIEEKDHKMLLDFWKRKMPFSG